LLSLRTVSKFAASFCKLALSRSFIIFLAGRAVSYLFAGYAFALLVVPGFTVAAVVVIDGAPVFTDALAFFNVENLSIVTLTATGFLTHTFPLIIVPLTELTADTFRFEI